MNEDHDVLLNKGILDSVTVLSNLRMEINQLREELDKTRRERDGYARYISLYIHKLKE